MRIVHASHGRFHHHDLARQLYARGMLERFFTGYPRWKLKGEDLPHDRISTFPWVETPYMALQKTRLMGERLRRKSIRLLHSTFGRYVASRMPDCDAFIGLSGTGLKAGLTVQQRGGLYVCDRGSSHIVEQDQLLREEFERQGQSFVGIDPWVIEREQAEYDQADLITVPSEFVRQTFLAQGVSAEKIAKVPYGVHLQQFEKIAEPPPDYFDVVFAGNAPFRKGLPDLLQAFSDFKHPRKRLTIVGNVAGEMGKYLARHHVSDSVVFTGHCPLPRLKEIFSRSHVMVLPSIEEGLALVMAMALACGCPVIASEHTGARDLFDDGEQGFVIPIRSPSAITERLETFVDKPELRARMSEAALTLVHERLGGWDAYGDQIAKVITQRLS